jgi:hypothetical protein
MSSAVTFRNRIRLSALLAAFAAVAVARPVAALDCPCTWEQVLCEADAAAEVEMVLSTATTPDEVVVRRVLWNRTKHRIRPRHGRPYFPNATKTRLEMRTLMTRYRQGAPPDYERTPDFFKLWRAVLKRGRYRLMIFPSFGIDHEWSAHGAAYSGHEWLDHPQHAEWWAKIEPALQQVIEASKRGEKPAFCANLDRNRTQLGM